MPIAPYSEPKAAEITLAGEMLYGVRSIAEFLGMPTRKAFHLIETRRLPAFKIGDTWVARKSTLIGHFEKLERAACT